MIQPATYWRENKMWKQWIGRRGTVLLCTEVHVAPPGFEWLVPYSYAVVEFGSERREFVAAGQEKLQPGDEVTVVVRKLSQPDASGIIHYGLKVAKQR